MAEKRYLDLEGLELYDQLIRGRIDAGDAPALKTVALSQDGKKMLFYNVSEPVGSTPPVYEIEFPEDDSILDKVMRKVATALDGNIGIFSNGTIIDSGKSFADYYTKTEVLEEIAKASKLEKRIVTTLPPLSEAKDNVIYMIKDNTVTGGDKYREYTLIDGQLVMIGDTSVDLSGYVSDQDLADAVQGIKTEVISEVMSDVQDMIDDATDDILASANQYTDQQVGVVTQQLTTINNNIATNATNISNLQTTVNTHTDQITALTQAIDDLDDIGSIASADIRALFD